MRTDIDNVNRFFMPPELLKKRPSKARMKRIKRRKRIRRLIALSVMVIAVIVLALRFTNAGCDIVLALAKNYVSENMNLQLKAESVKGNPLKGYSMKKIELEDNNGKKILSAESLSGYISYTSLIRGIIRLSEIFARGVSIDAEGSVNALQDMNVKYEANNTNTIHLFSSPALADELQRSGIIHLDRLRIRDGIINSRIAVMNISRVDVNLRTFTAEIDADINGLPLKGNIDIGDDKEITSINRADMNLGSGKITAVGGLFNDDIFDIHVTAESLNLKDVTAIFPEKLNSEDFNGSLNLNLDVTGTKEAPRIFGSIDYKGRKIYGLPVERMSANYSYSLNDYLFMMNNIQASSFSIPLQGEISAKNLFDDNATMRIKLDGSETNLEKLDEVLGIAELKCLNGKVDAFNANINGNLNSLNGLVKLTSPGITYMGRTFSNVRLQMKLSGSNTGNVEGKFTFEEANGFIQGNIESIFRGSNMNLTARIADIDIKRVENIIPDYPTYDLEGKITLSLNVKGRMSKPVITGALSSSEFKVRSQNVIKPVVDFMIEARTLTIEETKGTVNGIPLAITGTLKPIPSSNPELDITAGFSGDAKIRITGVLNDPSVSLNNESKDSKPEVLNMETVSGDMNHNVNNELSGDNMKEELSKDEDTIN